MISLAARTQLHNLNMMSIVRVPYRIEATEIYSPVEEYRVVQGDAALFVGNAIRVGEYIAITFSALYPLEQAMHNGRLAWTKGQS